MNHRTKKICAGGIIAALYAVLTLALPMLSYGPLQIRFSEALTVLPFLLPEAVPGLAIGCFLANLASNMSAIDWIFGTLATLIAAVWTSKMKNKWLAPLPPVICNAVIIGAEISWFENGFRAPFASMWALHGLTVGMGELLACYLLGLLLLRCLPKVGNFRDLVPPDRQDRLTA